jgi:hypothetical protein
VAKLVLVDAVGLKVEGADVADIFLLTPQELAPLVFYDISQVAEREKLFPIKPTPESKSGPEPRTFRGVTRFDH